MSTLIVIAKAPVPGRVKTRLCPPCSPAQAAALAQAALSDTLAAVLQTSAQRRVLALDGTPGDWLPDGFDVVAQRGKGFGQRLACAFAAATGPALLIAMDTPQVPPALLSDGLAALEREPAVLGLTPDGGYWTIGLRDPRTPAFDDVAMSTAHTGADQRRRLATLGMSPFELPRLTDVDDIDSARAVAAQAPRTRFAAALRASGHAADDHQAVTEATT